MAGIFLCIAAFGAIAALWAGVVDGDWGCFPLGATLVVIGAGGYLIFH